MAVSTPGHTHTSLGHNCMAPWNLWAQIVLGTGAMRRASGFFSRKAVALPHALHRLRLSVGGAGDKDAPRADKEGRRRPLPLALPLPLPLCLCPHMAIPA